MDYFEATVKTLLESDGFWVRQSVKVDVTKEDKKEIGRPTMPRPEIDLIAYKPESNEILAIEVKSFLDSSGVYLSDLQQSFDIPNGRYKLFTSKTYRDVVFKCLSRQLQISGLTSTLLPIKLGLAAGKVHKGQEQEVREYLHTKNMYFLGPSEIKQKIQSLALKGYENDPTVIAAKILMRGS